MFRCGCTNYIEQKTFSTLGCEWFFDRRLIWKRVYTQHIIHHLANYMHLFKFFFVIYKHLWSCHDLHSFQSWIHHLDTALRCIVWFFVISFSRRLSPISSPFTLAHYDWMVCCFFWIYIILVFLFLSQDHVYSITLILPPLNVRLLSHFAIICSNATQNPAPTVCLGVGFHQITK